jgi:predicted amidohydrolase
LFAATVDLAVITPSYALSKPLRRRLVRIALAQVDATLGDVEANVARARHTLGEAGHLGAELTVFPELQLSGYALATTNRDTARSVDELAELADDSTAVWAFHERAGERTFNSAAYFQDGSLVHVHRKLYLTDYPPFSEDVSYAPGETMRAFDTSFGRAAILICNDAWQAALPFLAVHDGAQILLVPACSSTAVVEAETYWRELTRFYARMLQCYVVFVNRVGSEGDFTFWGGSHVVDPWGEVVAEARRFEEELLVADVDVERVEERRLELPLVRNPRLDLLAAEIQRLRKGTRANVH